MASAPSPPNIAVVGQDLPELAKRINAEHKEAEKHLLESLAHIRTAGLLLIQAKGKVKHGQWEAWVRANLSMAERTAQKYMRVADQWAAIGAKAPPRAHLSVNDALTLIADKRADPTPDRGDAWEPEAEPTKADVGLLSALPSPVAFLLREGRIGNAHASSLLKLREVYGQGLITKLNFNGEWDAADLDARGAATVLFNARPAAQPLLWGLREPFSDPPPAVVEACLLNVRRVTTMGGLIPQWEYAAFWWACQAAMIPLSAADLDKHLADWREMFEDAFYFVSHFHAVEDIPKELMKVWPPELTDPSRRAEEWEGYADDMICNGAMKAALLLRDKEVASPELLACCERADKRHCENEGTWALSSPAWWNDCNDRWEKAGRPKRPEAATV